MNDLVFYNPECTVFKQTSGGKEYWYINYRLPNGKRMRRSAGKNEKEANKLKRIKQKQLLTGLFDKKDLAKMPLERFEPRQKEPLAIESAYTEYLEMTASNKSTKSHSNDEYALKMLFGWIQEKRGRHCVEEISPLDVDKLFKYLYDDGKSEATLKTYLRTVNKVFNWLIDKELFDKKNPCKTVIIPKKHNGVRDRLPSNSEIQALLTVKVQGGSRQWTPIQAIIQFLAFTGARVGEVLHAEWSDFDLDNGIWHIRYKADCPTKDGLGWSPKWEKERSVFLFPEALEVLKSIPRVETVGFVQIRDNDGKITGLEAHPASFIFAKKEISIAPNCPMKQNEMKFKCFKCGYVDDYEECSYRNVIYSRVDNIQRAFSRLKEKAGVEDLQLKDLRTYFNHILKSKFLFSSKEAGSYLGNSEEVNERHYSPVSDVVVRGKMAQYSLTDVLGVSAKTTVN